MGQLTIVSIFGLLGVFGVDVEVLAYLCLEDSLFCSGVDSIRLRRGIQSRLGLGVLVLDGGQHPDFRICRSAFLDSLVEGLVVAVLELGL